jgi:hypothetical protein
VNVENKVRDLESTKGIMNKEQGILNCEGWKNIEQGILNDEVGNVKAENNTAWCNGNTLLS